jgi:hypothetical protein
MSPEEKAYEERASRYARRLKYVEVRMIGWKEGVRWAAVTALIFSTGVGTLAALALIESQHTVAALALVGIMGLALQHIDTYVDRRVACRVARLLREAEEMEREEEEAGEAG